jgi:Flp pilus assembly protein CpaB
MLAAAAGDEEDAVSQPASQGSPTVRTPRIGTRFGSKAGGPLTLLGAVLAMLGFLAFVFWGGSGGRPAGVGPQKDVVVAARDLDLRTQVSAAELTTTKFAAADIPPGAFENAADVKGLITTVKILKGQPITSNLLAKSTDIVTLSPSQYLPIPSGYVALQIPTGEQQGVGGYIQAGDYVSVVAIVSGSRASNARTVFTNLHVIRVGPATTDGAAAKSTSGPSSSLTVVVTQCQAEFLNWFLVNSQIKYTLESYHDYKPAATGADPTCSSVDAAKGVTYGDVANRFPGIFNG